MKKIDLFNIYNLILEEKNTDNEIVLDSPIYDDLEKKTLDWAQIADQMTGYKAKNSSDRSYFGKKAHRKKINGRQYGFTRKEIKEIQNILKK